MIKFRHAIVCRDKFDCMYYMAMLQKFVGNDDIYRRKSYNFRQVVVYCDIFTWLKIKNKLNLKKERYFITREEL